MIDSDDQAAIDAAILILRGHTPCFRVVGRGPAIRITAERRPHEVDSGAMVRDQIERCIQERAAARLAHETSLSPPIVELLAREIATDATRCVLAVIDDTTDPTVDLHPERAPRI